MRIDVNIRAGVKRYALAVAGALAATGLRWILHPVLDQNLPGLTLYPAAVIVAVFLGAGPGLAACLLGLAFTEYWFQPGTIEYNGTLALRVAILSLTAIYVGRVGENLRQARRKSEAQAQAAQTAEAARRASEERMRAAFDHAALGIVEVDQQDRFIYVNDRICQILGYCREELLGLSVHELTVEEDRPQSDHLNAELHAGQCEYFAYEKRYRKRDGSPLWVRVTVSAIRDARQQFQRAIGTVEDITERKQTEAEIHRLNAELEARVRARTTELEAANKELEAFSYSVSHDLRAPLRAVSGFAHAALSEYGSHLPDEGQHYLHLICQGAQRMNELIDKLLDFSRLSRKPLSRQTVDTARLVQDTVWELAGKAGPSVPFCVGDLPPCEGDPALLKQVWLNLLDNALKYTRHRSRPQIEVGCRQPGAIYFVHDNGAGFDMKYASKLFQVFQRLHRQEDFEGTGVGLATVHRIIQRHGGHIWAAAALNQGATFYFTVDQETPPR